MIDGTARPVTRARCRRLLLYSFDVEYRYPNHFTLPPLSSTSATSWKTSSATSSARSATTSLHLEGTTPTSTARAGVVPGDSMAEIGDALESPRANSHHLHKTIRPLREVREM